MIPVLAGLPANFPQLKIELGFASTSTGAFVLNDATLGVLDTGHLSGEIWTDVTAYATSLDISRGSQRFSGPTIRYDAGTCTVGLVNTDGRFDPTNLTGPYVVAGASEVTPMRPVRISATWQGFSYPLFRGFVDSWAVDYGGVATTASFVATDATKVLGNYNGAAQSPVGAGETTGARINRILDNAGWSTALRLIQTGNSTVQATVLAQPAWDEILLTADSENGQVYINGSGEVQFQQRQDVFTNPRSTTSQVTFGDGAGEVPYEQIGLTFDDTQLANYVRIARTGGVEQSVQDTASQALNLTRTFARTDLVLTADSECLDYAGQILFQWKDPELRFDSITVHPSAVSDTTAFTTVLGTAFGDRVTVRRRPPAQSGSLVERQVLVRGVHHTVSPLDWHTSLTFQSATKWGFFTLDDVHLGVLDTDALTY